MQAKIHQYHFIQFQGEIGNTVFFKAGPRRGKKRDRIPWKVLDVEVDPTKCYWTNGGKIPQYIKLEAEIRGTVTTEWTCESQLIDKGRNQNGT